ELKFSNKGGLLKSILIKTYHNSFPITNALGLDGYDDKIFALVEKQDTRLKYVLETDALRITKTYELEPDDYTARMNVVLENMTGLDKTLNITINNYTIDGADVDLKGKEGNARDISLNEYLVITEENSYRKNNAHKFSNKNLEKGDEKVNLVGFRDRYFCALFKPDFETSGFVIDPISEKKLRIQTRIDGVQLKAGGVYNIPFTGFFGPEDLNLLQSYQQGFEKSKKFYRFGLLDAIAKIIYGLLHFIHKFIPSWGINIIIISAIIYFSMYPLTAKGMASMRRMQAMQPKVQELKDKYSKNPEKLNKELMQLYKDNKVNPVAGCLPFFFQMPVFIGLYQVLWRDVAFKGAGFLWIKDLSEPDRLFSWGTPLPFLGQHFNVLPFVMMIIMFFQQKINQKNVVLTDPAQIQQQKMMATVMPVFLGVIFYKFASGLTLYFTMFYLFSTFTQWKMSKKAEVV
ncbi:MAG: membrane protein insertase YidC, partial [Candidatus Omnitrophica bacterium]|nr:membrane protein insertase YidC [Candidatus Omnitrophota bacterium]